MKRYASIYTEIIPLPPIFINKVWSIFISWKMTCFYKNTIFLTLKRFNLHYVDLHIRKTDILSKIFLLIIIWLRWNEIIFSSFQKKELNLPKTDYLIKLLKVIISFLKV